MRLECVVVRYGEISLKGKNRSEFEQVLVHNVKAAVAQWPEVTVHRLGGRLQLDLNNAPSAPICAAVKRVFGVFSVSHAVLLPADLDVITEAALRLLRTWPNADGSVGQPATFKVESRRADKRFALTSPQLSEELGARLLAGLPGLHVDVHHPVATVFVDIREEGAYVYGQKEAAVGGMPVRSAGRVGLLLSGGIDSPVAGWLSLKRGVDLEAIHFHSYPFTSERALQKVQTLTQLLANWGGRVTLHTVGFTEVQSAIRKHCPESLSITVMRRMMLRIATAIAEQRRWLALVTGESLGQVASQTLESIQVINDVTRLPILRPLISEDKVDIIQLARKIGTYETSILPYEDCCTIFVPKHPRTRPTLVEAEAAERALDVPALVEQAVAQTTRQTFHAIDGLY